MSASKLVWALAALGLLAGPAGAVDLQQIDRSIRKEPVYQSKDPQYCLMVFGPEAAVRVWLVLDGDTLYVDRNGNGDLTEPGERFEAKSALHNSPERPDMKLLQDFIIRRPVKDGKPEGEPILSCVPEVYALILEHFVPSDERDDASAVEFRKKPFRVDLGTARYESDSSLAFAARYGDAPILHFDGPRQFALHPYSKPLRRGETCALRVQLLTPGLGASVRTFAPDGIGEVHPIAEVGCPPRRPREEPVQFRLELPGRG